VNDDDSSMATDSDHDDGDDSDDDSNHDEVATGDQCVLGDVLPILVRDRIHDPVSHLNIHLLELTSVFERFNFLPGNTFDRFCVEGRVVD
jgi:hypothetical protein